MRQNTIIGMVIFPRKFLSMYNHGKSIINVRLINRVKTYFRDHTIQFDGIKNFLFKFVLRISSHLVECLNIRDRSNIGRREYFIQSSFEDVKHSIPIKGSVLYIHTMMSFSLGNSRH